MSERQPNGRASQISRDAPRDRSFLARYGAIILRGGIAAIPTALFRYQGELDLTPQQVWFVSAILAHKWDAELPYPSLKRLAEHTGVSRQKLHDYQRQLLRAGHLVVINRRTAAGGQDTNFFDFSPLLRRLEDCLERDKPARDGVGEGGPAGPYPENDHAAAHMGVNEGSQPPVNLLRHTPVNGGRQPAVNPGLHEEEPSEETGEMEESNQDPGGIRRIATRAFGRGRWDLPCEDASARYKRSQGDGGIIPVSGTDVGVDQADAEERESVDAYVADLARELGDRAPLASSGARLLNLYRRSGLEMDAFVAQVQRARRTTKERLPQIRGERKPGRPKAAMSYFFAVLENLLGLTAAAASPGAWRGRPGSIPSA